MNWLFWAKAIGSDQMPLGMSNAIYHSDKSALGFMYFRFIIAVLAESRRCLCMRGMWRAGETVTWPVIFTLTYSIWFFCGLPIFCLAFYN